jgi:alpha-aminoadipate carrier protein LysW
MECLDCGAEVKIPDDAIAGEIVTCPECGASFELVSKEGRFDLAPAQVEGEDWGE